MSHYFAKAMFSPLLLSPIVDDWKFDVYLISDLAQETQIEGGKVNIDVRRWTSFEPTYHTEVDVGKLRNICCVARYLFVVDCVFRDVI